MLIFTEEQEKRRERRVKMFVWFIIVFILGLIVRFILRDQLINVIPAVLCIGFALWITYPPRWFVRWRMRVASRSL